MTEAGPLEPHEQRLEKLRAEAPARPVVDENARCPYCHDGFAVGLARAGCWACKAPHHARCLAEHGGCSVFGCEGGPRAAGRRPVVIRTQREPVEADWRVTRRRELTEVRRARSRELHRASGVLLLVPALVVLAILVAGPLPLSARAPALLVVGAFAATCLADVIKPRSDDVGRALRVIHFLFGAPDDPWTR